MRKAVVPVFLLGALIGLAAANTAAQSVQPPRDNPVLPSGTAIIRGLVVAMASGDPVPIRDARVSISAPDIDPVFTDSSGRFEFTRLAAGRYTLTAEKTGFVRTRFGAKNDFDPSIPVEVGSAAAISVVIRMARGAAMVGRVVDQLGDPVVGVPVSVGVLHTAGAETRFVGVAHPPAHTDDRGEYRVGGLAAGRYYVSVTGMDEGTLIAGAPAEWTRTAGSTRTFYPAAAGVAGATPIVLNAGDEVTGVDMMLAASPPATLTLGLADATGTLAPAGGLINLLLPGDAPGVVLTNRGVSLGPENGTMTPTLEPGDWIAVALGTRRALAHLHLVPGEAASLMLPLSPGARIVGRVVFDGASAPPALASIRLVVRGAGPDIAVPSSGLSNGPVTVKSDGSFEMTALAGTLELQPASPLRGWMLRSVKLGERDLLDNPLTLSGSEDISGVLVIFTDQLADLSGTAVDADGGPSSGCTVAMFPADDSPGFGSRRTRLLRADQNGRFSVSDLPTGSYLAAATPEVDSEAWLSADYLRRLRTIAAPVVLADRERKTIMLPCTIIP